jgi:DNA topoisomerase-2
MSDQDTDGSHIKGLVLNFIHHLWPSLFHMSGFMKQFITPLLKAFKGQAVESFFTLQDYKNWSETVNIKQWKIKYYKGLGTSTDK